MIACDVSPVAMFENSRFEDIKYDTVMGCCRGDARVTSGVLWDDICKIWPCTWGAWRTWGTSGDIISVLTHLLRPRCKGNSLNNVILNSKFYRLSYNWISHFSLHVLLVNLLRGTFWGSPKHTYELSTKKCLKHKLNETNKTVQKSMIKQRSFCFVWELVHFGKARSVRMPALWRRQSMWGFLTPPRSFQLGLLPPSSYCRACPGAQHFESTK